MASFRTRSADVSRFAMVPRSDVPRSVFKMEQTHKSTFDSGLLIPVYIDEILPGDSVRLDMTAFCRLATPLFPIMDNLYLDTFFFFVPNRLVWTNWTRFMGERISPTDSVSFVVPQVESASTPLGFAPLSIYDYLGLPVQGQANLQVSVNALPLRAYNLIWNEWFRDQNLQEPAQVPWMSDGPDHHSTYFLRRRGKRHDYFTSALPWPMRETTLTSASGFRFAGGAPVSGLGTASLNPTTVDATPMVTGGGTQQWLLSKNTNVGGADSAIFMKLDEHGYPDVRVAVNDMRQAFATQRLFEKDARGGTRYTEIVRSHFGVTSPDARLQRPEYLGGGSTMINVAPVAQTSASGVEGSATPLGQLGGVGTGVARNHGFSQSFTEHGYIIGLACVRADLTYQQGLERMWSRRTRFDYYWPSLAHLGEQAVKRKEIYVTGFTANDEAIFGYQERWAEYRYKPNRVSGLFRSTTPGAIDQWHLAQRFNVPPVLGDQFIQERPPVDRVVAVGEEANGQQILFDGLFSVRMVRAIPMFSVPGLSDHF